MYYQENVVLIVHSQHQICSAWSWLFVQVCIQQMFKIVWGKLVAISHIELAVEFHPMKIKLAIRHLPLWILFAQFSPPGGFIIVCLNLNCTRNYILKQCQVTSEDEACEGMLTVPPSTEVRPPSPRQRHQTPPTRGCPRHRPCQKSGRSGTACSTIPPITLYK